MNLNAMTAQQVADHIASGGYPDRKTRSRARRGVLALLQPLEGQPGETWQHRWVAANPEGRILHDLTALITPDNKHARDLLSQGLKAVVAHEIIRPGINLTFAKRAGRIVLPGVEMHHHDDLDLMVKTASQHKQVTLGAAANMRYAAAALILFTGRPLAQITPSEWVAAENIRADMARKYGNQGVAKVAAVAAGVPMVKHQTGFFEVVTFRVAYAACRQAGLMAPDPFPAPGRSSLPMSLAVAKAPAFTLASVLDANGRSLPPSVRALVMDVYSIEGGAFDNSTIKSNIVALNSYMRVVRQHLPGHDTLNIPKANRDAILRTYLNEDAKGRKPGTKKTAAGTALSNVRSFYRLASGVVAREELTEHLSTLGGFPWSDAALSKTLKNEKARREARLRGVVRDQIVHFDHLVPAAVHRLVKADALAALAHAAAPGETFEHDGFTYRRAARKPTTGDGGREPVYVQMSNSRRYVDADLWAFAVARTRVLLQVLRDSGLRVEEAGELGLEDLKPLIDGDITIPTMYVRPSKQDRSRTLGLTVDSLTAISDLVGRAKALYGGTYPVSVRFDDHEGEEQQGRQLVFFQFVHGTFTGVPAETLRAWLNEATDYYDTHHNTGAPVGRLLPHGIRRMFATDLNERGADITAIQQVLGHNNVGTTNTYLHPDENAAIAEVARARRQQALRDE